jgi:iron complex transport system ATP-binding protein
VSVLHEIGLALQADDLLLLREGRVAHHGACSDAATHRAVEAVFDQRVRVHPVAGRWVALPREPGEA